MDLSIIIVNWNSKEYLQKCIASILSETRDIEFEIIVIDSASYDGVSEMIQTHYPQVRFVQSEVNVGFARANNIAYAESAGKTLLFLNPDTELIGPAINVLYDSINSLPNVGIVGCKLFNSDRSVQTSCIQSFPSILKTILNSEYLRHKFPESSLWGMRALYEKGRGPKKVEAISGACMMLKRTVFEQVGLFSEDYFMYAEDIDLSYKVHQSGFFNYYVPDATVIHFGGSCSQNAPKDFSVTMTLESVRTYFRKIHGPLYGSSYRSAMFLSSICRIAALFLLYPLAHARGRSNAWNFSFGKWRAILRWSLFRNASIKKYRNANPTKVEYAGSVMTL